MNLVKILQSNFFLRVISVILFLFLLKVGFFLAERKPLWGDEIYAQRYHIEKYSATNLLFFPVNDPQNYPLFSLLQKATSSIYDFRLSEHLGDGQGDAEALMIMRIVPNICMSLCFVLIFYFCCQQYALLGGFVALAVIFLSPSIGLWHYWAEARPYALWMLLTTAQGLCFYYFLSKQDGSSRFMRALVIIHTLLSMLSLWSLIQITLISASIWFLKVRKVKEYVFLTFIPIVISLFYFLHSYTPGRGTWFQSGPLILLDNCFPWEWFVIVLFYGLVLLLAYFQDKSNSVKLFVPQYSWKGKILLVFLGLMFVMSLMMMAAFKAKESLDHAGMLIPHRYFLFLTVAGVIALPVFLMDIYKALKLKPFLRFNVMVILISLLLYAYFRYALSLWFF